jgi:hypothetical protein
MIKLTTTVFVVMALATSASVAHALPMVYTDRALFDANLTGIVSVEDFEGTAAGTLIPDGGSLSGITYNYPGLAGFGVSLAVTDGNQFGGGGPFSTTSGSNFLGTDDADILQGGDDIDLGFGNLNAIGMYFISLDTLLDTDIELTAGGATASLDASMIQSTLPDGSNVFFLGIIDTMNDFSTASITSSCVGCFLFNIDDIVTAAPELSVPEPSTLFLFTAGLLSLLSRKVKADA